LKITLVYSNRKHDEHDKWLEDVIENTVKQLNLVYHRNLEKLITKAGSYSLLQKDLGEIWFLCHEIDILD